jgi:hypothetical protein
MENNIEAVRGILERNDYQVTAFATDNGCLVIYPERVEQPVCSLTRIQYEYTNVGLRVIVSDEEGNIHKDKIYICPVYAQRLLMFSHIIARCIHISYAVALIVFVTGEDKVEEEVFYASCVNPAMSPSDIALENELKPIIIQCIFTVFTPMHEEAAKAANVLEGFLAIRSLLIGQPLKEEPNESQEENPVDGGS